MRMKYSQLINIRTFNWTKNMWFSSFFFFLLLFFWPLDTCFSTNQHRIPCSQANQRFKDGRKKNKKLTQIPCHAFKHLECQTHTSQCEIKYHRSYIFLIIAMNSPPPPFPLYQIYKDETMQTTKHIMFEYENAPHEILMAMLFLNYVSCFVVRAERIQIQNMVTWV